MATPEERKALLKQYIEDEEKIKEITEIVATGIKEKTMGGTGFSGNSAEKARLTARLNNIKAEIEKIEQGLDLGIDYSIIEMIKESRVNGERIKQLKEMQAELTAEEIKQVTKAESEYIQQHYGTETFENVMAGLKDREKKTQKEIATIEKKEEEILKDGRILSEEEYKEAIEILEKYDNNVKEIANLQSEIDEDNKKINENNEKIEKLTKEINENKGKENKEDRNNKIDERKKLIKENRGYKNSVRITTRQKNKLEKENKNTEKKYDIEDSRKNVKRYEEYQKIVAEKEKLNNELTDIQKQISQLEELHSKNPGNEMKNLKARQKDIINAVGKFINGPVQENNSPNRGGGTGGSPNRGGGTGGSPNRGGGTGGSPNRGGTGGSPNGDEEIGNPPNRSGGNGSPNVGGTASVPSVGGPSTIPILGGPSNSLGRTSVSNVQPLLPEYMEAVKKAFDLKYAGAEDFPESISVKKIPFFKRAFFDSRMADERTEMIDVLFPGDEVNDKDKYKSDSIVKRKLYSLQQAGVTPEILAWAMIDMGVITQENAQEGNLEKYYKTYQDIKKIQEEHGKQASSHIDEIDTINNRFLEEIKARDVAPEDQAPEDQAPKDQAPENNNGREGR